MGEDPRRTYVVSPTALRAELSDAVSETVLLDVRLTADRPDLPAYLAGHLPGALFVDVDTDLSGVGDGATGQRPLPAPEVVEKTLRRWGIDDNTRVVVYGSAKSPAPARAWWVLRWAGVRSVRFLDGGVQGWVDSGGVLDSGPAESRGPETDFTVATGALATVDVSEVAGVPVLLDTRPAAKFTAGHIPGARNTPIADVFDDAGYLKPDDELRLLFVDSASEPVTYCGSGVAAALGVLVYELLGIRARLYVGSMSEWTADPSRPVER